MSCNRVINLTGKTVYIEGLGPLGVAEHAQKFAPHNVRAPSEFIEVSTAYKIVRKRVTVQGVPEQAPGVYYLVAKYIAVEGTLEGGRTDLVYAEKTDRGFRLVKP